MSPEHLNELAHQIAYSGARGAIEMYLKAVNDPAKGISVASLDNLWYDLSTPQRDSFSRNSVSNSIMYLDGRGLLLRHRERPYLARVIDAPGDDVPVEGLRLEPIAGAPA